MAARAHVDSSVGERRLRPIYEWLDNGNNKKALQEAEKVLKKQPNFLCAKVLKALALLRLGKEEECEQILEFVRAEVPADESTLQAMTICYREIVKPERVCEIYEAAVRKDPSSEELLNHLFMAYVRVADYKKQQKTALQLYKLKPKNPYYFWAVMSVVMQAHKADPQLVQGVVLPLAERMVQKFIQEDRIEAEQEVQLYLMVLEMQSKFEEALRVVEGPLGEKLVSYVVVPLKRAELLMKLKRWREANVLFKQLLKEDMDRWSYLVNYLITSMKLYDSGQQNGNNNTVNSCNETTPNSINNNHNDSKSDETSDRNNEDVKNLDSSSDAIWLEADTTPVACCNFLKHLIVLSEKESQRRLRGPYLAQLEFYRMLSERGIDPEPLLGKVPDLLHHYVELFSEKPCCVSDLRDFLSLLPASEHSSFIQRVAATTVRDPEGGVPALQRHVCGIQLSRLLGAHLDLSEAQRQVLVTKLLLYYMESSHLSTENLQTEFACIDPYALLAAHVLVDSWLATGHSTPLVWAAQVLEMALDLSPSNFHIKLLLLRIYQALGAGAAADAIYEMLDVKHMQLDSLGYLHCSQLTALGQLQAAGAHYEATLKFFTSNFKDSVDHLTYSYKFGSFLKITEFVEFCERVNNSLHYASTTVERMLLELMDCNSAAQMHSVLSGMNVEPWKDRVAWDSLEDNRDTGIFVTWEPPCRQVTAEQVRQSFKDDVTLLRIRSLSLRIVAAAVELPGVAPGGGGGGGSGSDSDGAGAVVNGGEPGAGTSALLASLAAALAAALAKELSGAQEAAGAAAATPLCGLPPSRLHALLAAGAALPLAELAAAVAAAAGAAPDRAEAQRRAAAASEGVGWAAARAASRARSQAELGVEEPAALAGRRSALAHASAATELLALGSLVVGAGRAALRATSAGAAAAYAEGCAARRQRRKKQQQQHKPAPPPPPAPADPPDGDASAEDWPLECLCGLANALHAAAQTLDTALAAWVASAEAAAVAAAETGAAVALPDGDDLQVEAVARLEALSLSPSGPGTPPPAVVALVRTRLAGSLQSALRDLRRVLQAKLQYLALLRRP